MARILIFGGHGRVALLTAAVLTQGGDSVTAVIRNPDHRRDVSDAGAEPLVLDLEAAEVADLAAAIRGHDAVIWSAGAGGGDARRTAAVDHAAALRSMAAATAAEVSRYVMVSYFRSGADDAVPAGDPFRPYADAKAAADDALRATALDWTVLGPSRLTDDAPIGRIDVASAASTTVARGDVAAVIATSLRAPATFRRTIRFNTGATPIPEALGV
ncbi:NAD(P)H-binding protein [Microbacterium gorillae]|uniref:NAD(P)H-binding protein n=1 Tax=Microbacterium gorillae TaxID=1231063 RepID=UPI00058B71DD|nr:NAD(P)H-binding protein [Microbacterium gorillae]